MTRLAYLAVAVAALSGLLGGCSAIVDVDDYEFPSNELNRDPVGQYNTGCYLGATEEDVGVEYIYTFSKDGDLILDYIAYDSFCEQPIFVQTLQGDYEFRDDTTGGAAYVMTVYERQMKFVSQDGVDIANEISLFDYSDWQLNEWVDLLGVPDSSGRVIDEEDKLFILYDAVNADEVRISLPASGAVPLTTYDDPFYRTAGDEDAESRFP